MKNSLLVALMLIAASLLAASKVAAENSFYLVTGRPIAFLDGKVILNQPKFSPSIQGQVSQISPKADPIYRRIINEKMARGDSTVTLRVKSPDWEVVGLITYVNGMVLKTISQSSYQVKIDIVPELAVELHTPIRLTPDTRFGLSVILEARNGTCAITDPPPKIADTTGSAESKQDTVWVSDDAALTQALAKALANDERPTAKGVRGKKVKMKFVADIQSKEVIFSLETTTGYAMLSVVKGDSGIIGIIRLQPPDWGSRISDADLKNLVTAALQVINSEEGAKESFFPLAEGFMAKLWSEKYDPAAPSPANLPFPGGGGQ